MAEATSKTQSTAAPKGKEPVKPLPKTVPTAAAENFAELTQKLVKADSQSAAAGKKATQLKGNVSAIAVETILAAYAEKIDGEAVRVELTDAGVLKGTASKIGTVVTGLQQGVITIEQVESLSGAYGLVVAERKRVEAEKRAKDAEVSGKVAEKAGAVALPAEVRVATPEEAFQIILNTIRNEPNVDKAYELAGSWITRFTTETTAITKAKASSEE